MKTIIFIRHAKSSWDQPYLSDHDRPLNARGLRDLPLMATWAAQELSPPDALFTSTAKRALRTAEAFAQAWQIPSHRFQSGRNLYHASEANWMGVIRKLSDSYAKVAFVGHNPGLTDVINLLDADNDLDNLPTCAVYALQFPVKSWKAITEKSGQKAAFFFPKMLNKD
jgi:phosphohistidine phosphatase